MPTPPYAKVLVALNGTPVGSGGITVSGGDVVQLSPESTTGWRLQRWEITDAPPGFSAPAGWQVATDGSFFSTAVQPPTFTLPSVGASTWGKYAVRLRVNGNPLLLNDDGTRNAAYLGSLTDEGTMLSLLSSGGVEGIALGEDRQFDLRRGWLGALMRMARSLAASGGGGGGGGSTIPTPSLANAVVQVSTSGVITSAPLRMDQILAAWTINTFAIAQTSPVEVGTTITTPAFTATYPSTPTSAILTDTDGTAARTVTSTSTSFTSLGTFTKTANNASVTWYLDAHDATSATIRKQASVTWQPRLHYGTGAPGLRSAAAILALASNPMQGARNGSYTFATGNTAANLKPYLAWPSAYTGTPNFKVNGSPFAITLVAAGVSVTSNGVTQNYDLYEGDNVGVGTFTLDVT